MSSEAAHKPRGHLGSKSGGMLFTARTLLVLLGLLLAHALTLHFMGRIAWCECGFGFWTSHAWSNETSQMFADPYSATHVIHGILFYAVVRCLFPAQPLGNLLIVATAIEVVWEILENTPFVIDRYRGATAALDYTGDSVLNSVGDVCSAILGFILAAKLPWKWTFVLVIVIELVLLATIKDNLTLNVIMILFPLEAIKRWQTGG